MDSRRDPDAEPSEREIRLAELVDSFESMRRADASVGIGALREDAGELFPELQELAECLGVLRRGFGDGAEDVPSEFGPYRIDSRLGEGVSGVVYLARRGDGPPVALKVMRESLTLSADTTERFRREARVAEKLGHPHAVGIVDHGEFEGRLFLAMEYVEGRPLSGIVDEIKETCGKQPGEDWLRVLDRHGVPPLEERAVSAAEAYARRMAALFVGPARALAAADRAGLVHRDLKPANLLLRRDGKLVIVDFGLAKIVGEELTSTVAILGTPAFMSPEQAAGESRTVDARTDIYGLAASLYCALTHDVPIRGASFSAILAAILHKRPESLTSFCPQYPDGLAHVVARCLEKVPADRYADGDLLAADLERVAGGRKPRLGAVPLTRRAWRFIERYPRGAAAAGVAVVLLALFMTWWFTRPAQLTIRSIPVGQLALNGKVVGEVDRWSSEVARGEYDVRITRERFEPYEERVRLGPGAERELAVPLKPTDPFDEVALRIVADAIGFSGNLQLKPVPQARGLVDGDVFLPGRGTKVRRESPLLLVYRTVPGKGQLFVDGEAVGEIEGEEGPGFVRLPRLAEGEHVVRLEQDGETLETRIEVVAAEPLPGKLGDSDHGRFLRAHELSAQGFFVDALQVLLPVLAKYPDRAEPYQLALRAAIGLDLQESPLFHEWYAVYAEAKR